MTFMFHSRRAFSPLVIVALVWLLFCVSWPLDARAGASGGREGAEVAGSESASADGMGMVERDGTPKAVFKKKGFPWLLVLGGAVVVGVALYFFVFKKDKDQIHEDFDAALSDRWLTYHAANWNVAGGSLNVTAPDSLEYESVLYNQALSSSDFTVTVRMKRVLNIGSYGIVLSAGASMSSVNGYFFNVFADGEFSIFRESGYQFGPRTSSFDSSWYTMLKNWTANSAVPDGLDAWGVFKVVRAGSTYSFIANDTLLYTFTDATYDPRYVAVVMNPNPPASGIAIDYFYVDMGAASLAAVPITAVPQSVIHSEYNDPAIKE